MLQYITMISCVLIILHPAKDHPRKDFPKNLFTKGPDKGWTPWFLHNRKRWVCTVKSLFQRAPTQKMEKGSCLYSLSPFQILFEWLLDIEKSWKDLTRCKERWPKPRYLRCDDGRLALYLFIIQGVEVTLFQISFARNFPIKCPGPGGGWTNPFEKYARSSNCIISPGIGVNIKMFEPPTSSPFFSRNADLCGKLLDRSFWELQLITHGSTLQPMHQDEHQCMDRE